MLPALSDPDSNDELEVYCVDGAFLAPNWPLQCEEEVVCTIVPTPPEASSETVDFTRSPRM